MQKGVNKTADPGSEKVTGDNKLGFYESSNTLVTGILEDLSGICEVTYLNHYGSIISESTSAQRVTLAQLGINTDSWLQKPGN